MSWINRNAFFSLLLLLLSLLISVVFFEVVLRVLDIGYGNAPLVSNSKLHHSHPVDYKFRSHNPTNEYGGHIVYYDENGLMSARTPKIKRLFSA